MPPRKPKAPKNIVGVMDEPSISVPTMTISELPQAKPKRKYVRKVKPAPAEHNEMMYGGMDEAPAVNTVVPSTALPGLVKRAVGAIEKKTKARISPMFKGLPLKLLKELTPKQKAVYDGLSKEDKAKHNARVRSSKGGKMRMAKTAKPVKVSDGRTTAEKRSEALAKARAVRAEMKAKGIAPKMGAKREQKLTDRYLAMERGEGHVKGKAKFLKQSDYHLNVELNGLDGDALDTKVLAGKIKGFKFHRKQDVAREVREIRHLAREARKELRKGEDSESLEELKVLMGTADVRL